MPYLHGQGASLSTLSGASAPDWEGVITRIDYTDTINQAQVKVMGQAFANTVTGAYHTTFRIGFAVDDGFASNELEVGTTFTSMAYKFGSANGSGVIDVKDAVVTDVETIVDAEGAVIGNLTIEGNSSRVHGTT